MGRWRWAIAAAALAVMAGCGKKSDGGASEVAKAALNTPTAAPEEETDRPVIVEEPAMIGAVEIQPTVARVTTPLTAVVTTAPGFTLRYEWFVNGRSSGLQISESFEGPFKRGDSVKVIVTPHKMGIAGIPMASSPVSIQNSAPVYSAGVGSGFTLNGHVFQVTDPDGDAITFSLAGAPPGLSIESDTGKLSWNPPPPKSGQETKVYETMVTASDGNGGEVKVGFPVTIKGG